MSIDNSHLFVCYPTKSQKNIERFEVFGSASSTGMSGISASALSDSNNSFSSSTSTSTSIKVTPAAIPAAIPVAIPAATQAATIDPMLAKKILTQPPIMVTLPPNSGPIAVPTSIVLPQASPPPKPSYLNIKQDNLSAMQQQVLFGYNSINITGMSIEFVDMLRAELQYMLKLVRDINKSNVSEYMTKVTTNIQKLPEGLSDSQRVEILTVRKNIINLIESQIKNLPEPLNNNKITNVDVVNDTGIAVSQMASNNVIKANDAKEGKIQMKSSNSFKGTFDSNGIPYTVEVGGNFPNVNFSLSSGTQGFEMSCSPTNSSKLVQGMHSNLSLNIAGNVIGIQCALNEKK